eukprot:gnl/TRDRNA2_/TRDRNA2_177674_c0_seq1.p1 gnl/TRDRNA2_/TRDRNA2_177674_c0~~gnl/TRDRNA2_/TRDRNA2_177674_c0_seq1.p1  ORF type:complete len:446 (-),score=-51.17 gnl/TRDRNA2_/TRDRNA2_177674_c0_seq1:126-1463(-)
MKFINLKPMVTTSYIYSARVVKAVSTPFVYEKIILNTFRSPKEVWLSMESCLTKIRNRNKSQSSSHPARHMRPSFDSLENPSLFLQGLTVESQSNLYFHCLTSLKDHVKNLPESLNSFSDKGWKRTILALQVSCAAQACHLLVGYVPHKIRQQIRYLAKFKKLEEDREDFTNIGIFSEYNLREKLQLYVTALRFMRFGSNKSLSYSEIVSKTINPNLSMDRSDTKVFNYQDFHLPRDKNLKTSLYSRMEQSSFLIEHIEEILQDLLINVAEVVSESVLSESTFGYEGGPLLALFSQQDVLPCSYWMTFLNKKLKSSRNLEKFKNKVFLKRIYEIQLQRIISIYEDRYDLWGIRASDGSLLRRKLLIRRTRDILELSGWKLFLCSILGLTDIILYLLKISSVLFLQPFFSLYFGFGRQSFWGYLDQKKKSIKFQTIVFILVNDYFL